MKKVGIICLFVFVFGIACTQNSAEAQSSNDAQRIVGTWSTPTSGGIGAYTFNTDGTYVYTHSTQSRNENGKYFVNGFRIIFTSNSNDANVYEFYLSSNGRILFISYDINTSSGIWFEKQ